MFLFAFKMHTLLSGVPYLLDTTLFKLLINLFTKFTINFSHLKCQYNTSQPGLNL